MYIESIVINDFAETAKLEVGDPEASQLLVKLN